MIIGINGKIGVGKDTVGKIIQYLTYPHDIDIQTYLEKEVNGQFEIKPGVQTVPNFKIKKFAGKLKTIASMLTGIPVKKFEDQEFKKTDLPNEWIYVKPGYPARNMTVRDLLQKLGTEVMRDGLHANVWVNALFADYKHELKDCGLSKNGGKVKCAKYPNWIITDMRFPNEMEAVKQKDGVTIRVTRKLKIGGKDYGYTYVDVKQAVKDGIIAPEHPSETALDDAEFDYEIVNDAGIPELIEKVREILIKEQII